MYSKLGSLDYARKVFDEMPVRNVVSWTSLISSYSQKGLPEEALNCFRSMILVDDPNDYTYVAAISACAQIGALRFGKEIHGKIVKTGEVLNSFVSNCLIKFYGNCGMPKSARVVFDAIPEANVASCVSLMSNYLHCGDNEEALEIFLRSLRMGVKVNEFSYGSVLGACAALEVLEFGMQFQCLAIKVGVRTDQFIVTNLVNFYAKCGELELAKRAFREADKPNVTAWTALIGGCVQFGKHGEAINIFRKMCSVGLQPNEQTVASVLGALGIHGGTQLHCMVLKMGFQSFTFVSNSLLDFYAKINRLDESFKVFSEMDVQNIITWNTLIAGCLSVGRYEAAIAIIRGMFSVGFDPNTYTYSSILTMCGELTAVNWGQETHCHAMRHGVDCGLVIGSSLIDMYAKCGHLGNARNIFDVLPNKNLISWNAMMTGYTRHGFGKEALDIYNSMVEEGVKPDDVTFIGVLSACVDIGDLEEALRHFQTMTGEYGINPRADHVACVVNLFSHRGQTKEAYEFIVNCPVGANKVVWRALLACCVANRDLEMAEYATEKILSIDPNDGSARIMLSHAYADSNMWDQAREVRKEKTMKKETAYTWT